MHGSSHPGPPVSVSDPYYISKTHTPLPLSLSLTHPPDPPRGKKLLARWLSRRAGEARFNGYISFLRQWATQRLRQQGSVTISAPPPPGQLPHPPLLPLGLSPSHPNNPSPWPLSFIPPPPSPWASPSPTPPSPWASPSPTCASPWASPSLVLNLLARRSTHHRRRRRRGRR